MRILIAEDEKDLNKVIKKRLEKEGYSVDNCFDGEEALDFIMMGEFDVIILDIMMPKLSGIQVLEKMRSKKDNTPVIFLTAKDSIDDRVIGLDAGADDYIIKPFSLEELLARIRVILRKQADTSTNTLSFADLTIDIKSRRVWRSNTEIELSAKEYEILEFLMRNKDKVLSREKIENHVWNFDYTGGTNVVDVYIRYLRKKIDDPFDKKLIQTIRGAGYVLREEK